MAVGQSFLSLGLSFPTCEQKGRSPALLPPREPHSSLPLRGVSGPAGASPGQQGLGAGQDRARRPLHAQAVAWVVVRSHQGCEGVTDTDLVLSVPCYFTNRKFRFLSQRQFSHEGF